MIFMKYDNDGDGMLGIDEFAEMVGNMALARGKQVACFSYASAPLCP